jgi:trehalose 6-phosphate phosphatase
MKDLVLPLHRRVLARLLDSSSAAPLLAFDYDGVLAPLIRDPRGAPMSRRTRGLVTVLAGLVPVAVVSGRSFAKLHRVVGGVTPWLVGNHGFELLHETPVPAEVLGDVRRWERQVAAAVGGIGGVHVEHKRSTFAVHWTQAPDRARAARAVRRAVAALDGVRLVPGRDLVNVLPAAFPTKGDAIRRLLQELGCRRALFVGDDVTDEDVFALPPRLVLGVHVGRGRSRAAWRIADREAVDELLEELVRLARARAGSRPGARAGSGGRIRVAAGGRR